MCFCAQKICWRCFLYSSGSFHGQYSGRICDLVHKSSCGVRTMHGYGDATELLAASKLGKWVQSHCVLGKSSCKEQHAGLGEALALPALGSRGSEQLSPAPRRARNICGRKTQPGERGPAHLRPEIGSGGRQKREKLRCPSCCLLFLTSRGQAFVWGSGSDLVSELFAVRRGRWRGAAQAFPRGFFLRVPSSPLLRLP